MSTPSFTLTLLTEQSPDTVFQVVTNVRDWWSGYYAEEITGGTAKLNDEFTFRARDGVHYSKQKLIEVIPGQKIVWLITESNLSFALPVDEWTGTRVIVDIAKKGSKTQLTFTHQGLTSAFDCYDNCAPAWTQYLENKLLPLINKASVVASAK